MWALLWFALLFGGAQSNPSASPVAAAAGNEACAKCHQKIYDSYKSTAMAIASGLALGHVVPGEFRHAKSGVQYRIYEAEGDAWLSFERPGDPSVKGKRKLQYYIGSDRTGRTYLFSTDGFLFESPINWYAQKKLWDMAPAYQDAREIPLNLPAVPDCLTCHASGMRPPIAGTENRYAPPAIAHGGVTCQRCHGDDLKHANGKSETINPAKLSPDRRDAICMQCHLEGTVAIGLPGKHLYDFQPGAKLSDYVRYFVLQDKKTLANPALSQVEAMAQSVCKQKSGDRMSCMSCHDPHSTPSQAEKVEFYRAKCLDCHGQEFGQNHHAKQPDCTSCHMPFKMGTTVAHTQATDHRILRRPPPQFEVHPIDEITPLTKLIEFPAAPSRGPNDRELALAWESLAEGGLNDAIPNANRLVESATRGNPKDPALLSALGYLEQRRGNLTDAVERYQQALKFDPDRLDAAVNLGVIQAQQGHLGEAVKLWQSAFQRAPGRSVIGMNLARAFCSAGQYKQAQDYVLRVLQFNPDLAAAKSLLTHLNAAEPSCGN
jgi:predicted CXXCH cytochrome family protein